MIVDSGAPEARGAALGSALDAIDPFMLPLTRCNP
jgi:hypothetical protein